MPNTFNPPQRILLGPGPSNVEPRILQAMIAPLLGHLDPVYLDCLNEIQKQLRDVFETRNRATFSISGTGGAGMETCIDQKGSIRHAARKGSQDQIHHGLPSS